MSRGGRRRRKGGGQGSGEGRGPGKPQGQTQGKTDGTTQSRTQDQTRGQAGPQARTPKPPGQQGAEAASSSSRRRRRRRGAVRDGSRPAVSPEAPARPRPRRATTLPPDGVVLEEVISTMQSEYGTPTTPQEYRLLVKVGTRESPAPPEEPPAEGQPQPATARRRSRLRRRPRRPGTKPAGGDTTSGAEPKPPGPAEE